MYHFKIGEIYETQEGDQIQAIERHDKIPGYETVLFSDGYHRYDRSAKPIDTGKVTGTPYDYSDPRNIKRI